MVDGGEAAPAPEVAALALRKRGPTPRTSTARARWSEIERILAEGNGADRQRAAFERGGIPAVLEYLAEATAAD